MLLLFLNSSLVICTNYNTTNANTTVDNSQIENQNAESFAVNSNGTMSSLADHNKFIITQKSNSSDLFISLTKPATTNSVFNTATMVIMGFVATLGLTFLIILSTICGKKKKGLNSEGSISGNNANEASTKASNDIHRCTYNENDGGHENIAVSSSESTESIRIENEINNAIQDIANNETVETAKLLQQEEQILVEKLVLQSVIDLISKEQEMNEIKKSSSKLNNDIEKQPLNHE